ncbi:MAG: hypothetical protein AAF664_03215 [Planctomycetota bacterium]
MSLSHSVSSSPENDLNFHFQRRRVLAGLFAGSVISATTGFARDIDPVVLRSDAVPTLHRVRMTVEVKGNVSLAKNPIASRDIDLRMPMKTEATLDFEQNRMVKRNTSDSAGEMEIVGSRRYFHEAKSSGTIGRRSFAHELRNQLREIDVVRHEGKLLTVATDAFLERDESELLETPVDSTNLEAWLPMEAVMVGDQYTLEAPELLEVLPLSSVDSSNVVVKVTELDDQAAKFEIKGQLDGSVEGVLTRVRLVGKMNFDRESSTCDWLALAIHETRGVGLAEPGLDVSATIKMIRKPLDKPVKLPKFSKSQTQSWLSRYREGVADDRLYLALESQSLGFDALMSRDWRLMSDIPGSAMLRCIQDDRSVAQCDVKRLPNTPEGKQLTIEAFQEDVKQTLGEQLGQLTKAQQGVSAGGLRVLRVAASGKASGVPIDWIFLHFSDDSGRRLLATFTMQADQRYRFAGSDSQLADSLRMSSKAPGTEMPAKEGEVAARISTKPEKTELQSVDPLSASDLR